MGILITLMQCEELLKVLDRNAEISGRVHKVRELEKLLGQDYLVLKQGGEKEQSVKITIRGQDYTIYMTCILVLKVSSANVSN